MSSPSLVFPGYHVLGIIGQGSYGTVHRALDLQDGKHVAIKHITGMFQGSPLKARSDAQRVLREMKLLRLLKGSEDMVQLKTIILPETKNFQDLALVFELMEADLDKVIKINHDLQPEHHQWFLFQMLRCLGYMHEANILHRDLKPRNILVNSDCNLKICDLGLARPASEDETSEFWTDYVATRWYRAPELCGSFSATYTTAVDVWSLGCIFAELLLRHPMFCGRDVVHQLQIITDILGTPSSKTIAKVHNHKARAFLASMPNKPGLGLQNIFYKADPRAVDLLQRMLQFDPDERITAAEALRHPYFQGLYNLAKQPPTSISPMEFAYEKVHMQVEDIMELMWLEIMEYHPQVQKMQEERFFVASASMSDLQSIEHAQSVAGSVGGYLEGSFSGYLVRGMTSISEPGFPTVQEELHERSGSLEKLYHQCLSANAASTK